MPNDNHRQPHAPPEQPTDFVAPEEADEFNSSRTNGSPPPPATPGTPVSTRPLLGHGKGANDDDDPIPTLDRNDGALSG